MVIWCSRRSRPGSLTLESESESEAMTATVRVGDRDTEPGAGPGPADTPPPDLLVAGSRRFKMAARRVSAAQAAARAAAVAADGLGGDSKHCTLAGRVVQLATGRCDRLGPIGPRECESRARRRPGSRVQAR